MLLANPERLGLEVLAAALQPSAEIDLLAFAEQHVVFDEGPFVGPYSRQLFPFFDEILRALGPRDPARYITLASSAQVGKTALATIFCLGSITLWRGSFLFAHPTEQNAVRFAKMKLLPMMRSMPIVNAVFPHRTNDSQASILYRERRDGLSRLLLTGANSPASLSQISIDNSCLDDLAKWDISNMGDPELMAESRSRAMPDAKIFKISTPLIEPGCRITRSFRDGSQEMPYVPCLHCGTYQILEPENFLANIDPANPDDAHFTCSSCGSVIEEFHRQEMLAGFEWRGHNPSAAKEHRSFWIWSAYSYLQSWPQIAREWLKAKGDPASEKTFWNDALGKAFEMRGDGRPWEELAARAAKSDYARGTVPKGELILTLGIDVQTDRVEYQVLAHGERYQRFVVDVGTVGKHISEADCQRNLDLLLERKWPNTFGHSLGISLAAIDAGFSTDDVLGYVRRHGPSKLIAVRGMPGDTVPRISLVRRERDEKRGTILKFSKRFYNVGVNNFKFSLYKDLAKDSPEAPGFISFPRDLPDSYFQELVVERRVAHKRLGQVVYHWEKPERAPNESMDTFVYASAAAIKLGVNWISDQGWAKRREQLESSPDDKPPQQVIGPVTAAQQAALSKKPTLASRLAR